MFRDHQKSQYNLQDVRSAALSIHMLSIEELQFPRSSFFDITCNNINSPNRNYTLHGINKKKVVFHICFDEGYRIEMLK